MSGFIANLFYCLDDIDGICIFGSFVATGICLISSGINVILSIIKTLLLFCK